MPHPVGLYLCRLYPLQTKGYSFHEASQMSMAQAKFSLRDAAIMRQVNAAAAAAAAAEAAANKVAAAVPQQLNRQLFERPPAAPSSPGGASLYSMSSSHEAVELQVARAQLQHERERAAAQDEASRR